jgi:hypothetical protein
MSVAGGRREMAGGGRVRRRLPFDMV